MTDYTLTQDQVDALNALPPGLYLVCSGCRSFRSDNTTITMRGAHPGDMFCEECA